MASGWLTKEKQMDDALSPEHVGGMQEVSAVRADTAVVSIPATGHGARLVVIEPLEVVRQGICTVLAIDIPNGIAGFSSVRAAVRAPGVPHPDLVVLEPRAHDGALPEALALIAEAWPTTRVLLYFMALGSAEVRQGMAAGVVGYLPKSASELELRQAISSLCAGAGYVHSTLLDRFLRGTNACDPMALTRRELSVLELVCDGLSNQQIAAVLNLKLGTTKVYVSRILSKLGVADRTQAVLHALREGLVSRPGMPWQG